jgi:YceI-like domain
MKRTALPHALAHFLRQAPPMALLPVLLLTVLLTLLAGCAGRQAQPGPVAAAAGDSAERWYRQAASNGKQVLAIDPGQSLIAITVRRGGALARLGHDHLIASRAVTGFVAPDDGRADFHFRLDQMTVDEPVLRREAALDTQPSAGAVEGTRTNMLTRVLEAQRFPLVLLHAERVAGQGDTLRLAVTLHGVTRSVDVPTRIEKSADGITASGTLQLRQSAFGITPMSVMGGAITVTDTMELQFRIVARPLQR